VGFAQLEPELMKNFEIVERSIHGAAHLVTYSSRVKWNTLVDKYSASPDAVSVIPHASWDLSPWLTVRGFADQEQATRQYCERLLNQALTRTNSPYIHSLVGGSMRFLFYPSQFRPNKNLLTLLRAYEYLVRERFIPHKLILTGDPMRSPPVEEFIRERQLGKDVLCLHGLSTPELAACYHLADLGINPSLSEGGFPFTLTEAISVETPVVMARIPVTEEVIEDPALQEMMLFDPYDWRDAAARIEWALQHRESLIGAQREFCARLGQRTWRDVVGDYVAVLDRLAEGAAPVEADWK
jgi:glycosyltransferase involved in cell wall biosynthesis